MDLTTMTQEDILALSPQEFSNLQQSIAKKREWREGKSFPSVQVLPEHRSEYAEVRKSGNKRRVLEIQSMTHLEALRREHPDLEKPMRRAQDHNAIIALNTARIESSAEYTMSISGSHF